MPFISDVTLRLRFQTCKIIDELILQGKAKNRKEAMKIIIKKAKNLSGFSGGFVKSYHQYIMFKKKYVIEFHSNCVSNENDEFYYIPE